MELLITTNANTMNDKVRSLLERGLKLSFNISIDSLKKPVYEQIRKNAVFENVMENIGVFADYARKHNTSVGFLICPLTLNRNELPDFIGFAEKYHASLSYHVVFKPASLALWTLPAPELERLSAELKKHLFNGHDFISDINARNYAGLVDLVTVWAARAKQREDAESKRSAELKALIDGAKIKFYAKISAEVSDPEKDSMYKTLADRLIANMDLTDHKDLVFIRLATIPGQQIIDALNNLAEQEMEEKLRQYHNDVYYRFFAGDGLSDNDKYELSMKGMSW
jgi:hypothetical protein